MIRLRRAYEAPSADDGRRVLVERLWPRGLSKERAALDLWLKEVGPSSELRTWFSHDPAKWPEFQRRYEEELRGKPQEVAQLVELSREATVTFIYGSRDEEHNAAVVLKGHVEARQGVKDAV